MVPKYLAKVNKQATSPEKKPTQLQGTDGCDSGQCTVSPCEWPVKQFNPFPGHDKSLVQPDESWDEDRACPGYEPCHCITTSLPKPSHQTGLIFGVRLAPLAHRISKWPIENSSKGSAGASFLKDNGSSTFRFYTLSVYSFPSLSAWQRQNKGLACTRQHSHRSSSGAGEIIQLSLF